MSRARRGTFADEGAKVFLAGRTRETLDDAAEEITSVGGSVEVTVLDATDEQAVDGHARDVAAKAGGIDVSFNLISRGDVQGTPLVEMTTEDLLRAATTGLQSSFVTARAAARRMIEQGVRRDPRPEQRVGRRGDARHGRHPAGRCGDGGCDARPGWPTWPTLQPSWPPTEP